MGLEEWEEGEGWRIGKNGKSGKNGNDGKNGKDGKVGKTGKNWKVGEDGKKGVKHGKNGKKEKLGKNGKNGVNGEKNGKNERISDALGTLHDSSLQKFQIPTEVRFVSLFILLQISIFYGDYHCLFNKQSVPTEIIRSHSRIPGSDGG